MSTVPEPIVPVPNRCRNCGQALAGPPLPYCPACGQETDRRPPTLREFAHQFAGNYIAAEGTLWRTLALLLFRPGRLTLEYLAGRKRRYVLPVRLYLTISLLALLVMRLTAGVGVSIEDSVKAGPAPTDAMLISVGSARAGIDNGRFVCQGLPQSMCERLRTRFDTDPKSLAREARQLPERFLEHWGTAMFLLVPTFALWLKLVYLGGGARYAEHLVFALHLHAFWFAMLLVLALAGGLPGGLALLAIPVYALLALRRVYADRWWMLLLRAAALSALYGLTLLLAILVVAFWAAIF